LRCASKVVPVPSLSVVVAAAMKDSAVEGWVSGVSGADGDGGTCGSGSTTCSPVHTDSNPDFSARVATSNMVSGSPQAPTLIPNNPSFMMLYLPEFI